ncbi:DNA methyltransferase [Siphonobacter sp. SORGH_AS_0500]|uniref:DNA-methyltransferase n=1 Tax=Siphonobacter sp. SORGH_AS_0500 TaxID=1864824 RepID=UPI0028557ECC|nr:DNA methyltransferase [Siphonobacter sp. SORGH_AS_0500]MDR6195935.1 site-specific DNA-methyltransferase (adenine-specific) [Siphonobacter sp. SORGH_AS_0500]
MDPIITNTYQIFHGDSLEVLRSMPTASVDAIITDPPYSSGGLMRSDKMKSTTAKYLGKNGGGRPAFSGDNRDQRSWIMWCILWMNECRRILKPGGYFLVFTDWRQLPACTDAYQGAGMIWRGIISWDKGRAARAPHKGYFRHQCEYVIWGTNGPLAVPEADGVHPGPFDGSYTIPVVQSEKLHQTAKPVSFMRKLVKCVPAGGVILDPFMGSATTGEAALEEGCKFWGVEMGEDYFDISAFRLKTVAEALA